MPISSLFSIGQRALLANEVALGVAGGNIANVNTRGYTRQVADLAADPPVGGGYGGAGVHVAAVTQILDPLLQARLMTAVTERQGDAERRDQLSALAGQLNDLDT